MNRHPLLASVAKTLSGHLEASPDIEDAILSTGTFSFSGDECRTVPYTIVTARTLDVAPRAALDLLAEDLLNALVRETTFRPGAQKAALVAYRSRGEVRIRLARSWIDASGTQPTHDILVAHAYKQHRARIGSLVGSLQEVRADGSLLYVQGMTSGESPARKARLHAPNQSMPNIPICMHIPEFLGLAHPTQEDLMAWSDAHYGRLELEANAPAAYHVHAYSKYD